MWSLRKGARDWPEIMRTIREKNPAISFVFLGTMFSEDVVRTALGPQDSPGVQCLATYDPAELPRLLADCSGRIISELHRRFRIGCARTARCRNSNDRV